MSGVRLLTGRRALVTGAANGIGLAVTRTFIAEGATVAAVDCEPVPTNLGKFVHPIEWDLSDTAGIDELVRTAEQEIGPIDVLVNNAGSPQPRIEGGLADIAAAWESTFRANTLSVVLMTEAVKPLLSRPGGRVIVIGSFAGRGGTGSPAYASAKGALESYVITLMREVGPEGITANVVAPGYTQGTELLAGRVTPERHERLIAGNAARRAGTPEEIASLVAYLASDGAAFINGQTITANGGTYLSG